jgi:beta-mannosidase
MKAPTQPIHDSKGAAHLIEHARRDRLESGWDFARTEPGAFATPDAIASKPLDWQATKVPCTLASTLRDQAGNRSLDSSLDLDFDESDFWFRCQIDGRPWLADASAGGVDLICHGLATIADLWLNDRALGRVENMFVRSEFDVSEHLAADNTLWICFRALGPRLREEKPRARWRTALVRDRNLRFERTTLLGRMESWNDQAPVVGPWRGIELAAKRHSGVLSARLRPAFDGDRGTLAVDLLVGSSGNAGVGSHRAEITVGGSTHAVPVRDGGDGRLHITGRIELDTVESWWPHTHGTPRLYPVSLTVQGSETTLHCELEPVGFRRVELVGPPGPDFEIRINGEAIFCRGTCWTPVDPLALDASPTDLRAALEQARDAGMNMLRISGTMVYESDLFYRLCDELGMLVWQDFMFSTLDYPVEDEGFAASVRTEAAQFLDCVGARACLAMFCGNAEGQQQPAMLGLTPEKWANEFFDATLPTLCRNARPDVPYWPSTPSGGALPFHPASGTSHYFGVGAYRRPLADAQLAKPRFITECLAFAHLPGPTGLARLDRELASASARGAALDRTRRRAPRDRGANWDFADVSDHYIEMLFAVDAARLRREDPERHDALARATSAEVLYDVQSRWRRPASGCHGALVWLHRDPWRCAGWGIIDFDGRPKSAYAGLRRAWKPIAISILDEGLNGLALMVYNDRAEVLIGEIEVELLRFEGRVVAKSRIPIELAPRSSTEISIDGLLGGFVDSSYAYRFGPPGFDLCHAQLHAKTAASDARPIAEIVQVVSPIDTNPDPDLGLSARWLACSDRIALLEIASDHFARNVSIEFDSADPDDDFFHLAPGRPRRIELRASGRGAIGAGCVRAVNAPGVIALDVPGPGPNAGSRAITGRP